MTRFQIQCLLASGVKPEQVRKALIAEGVGSLVLTADRLLGSAIHDRSEGGTPMSRIMEFAKMLSDYSDGALGVPVKMDAEIARKMRT